jgi:UDP-N-acetylglucosamine 4,6-dehydratase
MVRWFMEFEEILAFVIKSLEIMKGGETFVPRNAQRVFIDDLAKHFAKNGKVEYIGIRRGERLEEILIDPTEEQRAEALSDMWIVRS